MPLTKFGWVDILFVTILIRIGYVAFKNGILPEFLRLAGLFSAFILSFNNYTLVSHFISAHTKWNGASPDIVSFLFIFLVTLFIFKLIASAPGLLSSGENVSPVTKIIALTFGCGRALLLISLIYTLFLNGPIKYLAKSAREKSMLSQYIAGIAPATYETGIKVYPLTKVETPLVKLLSKEKEG